MLADKYIDTNYSSYEDFSERYNLNVPENFNFAFDVVDEYAKISPEKRALVWCNEDGDEKVFTFKDIKYYSNKAANFLKSLGIKKGDPVMLILKRRYQYWIALIALHKIGAVAIPATHLLTVKDIVYRNNAASVKMIICVDDKEIIKRIDESEEESSTLKSKVVLKGSYPSWHNFEDGMSLASDKFEKPSGSDAAKNEDLFLLYFTSGTTGYPKMVTHNYTYPLGHIITAKYWQNVEEDGLHLTLSDTGWAKAAWGKIYGQWICGSAVMAYDFERFDPHSLLNIIQKYKVTTFCAPPTVLRYLIKDDLEDFNLSSLKYCAVAGEPLNPEVYNKFLKTTGVKLMEGYGQTETTVLIANFPWMEPKPGAMGKPSPGYDIDIVDCKCGSCCSGEEGEIVIRTKDKKPVGMFSGYYQDKELTESVFKDNIYYTGDVAYKDEDGYFWFVGRSDDVFKSSGYRISPFEVESALIEHPGVLECAITAVPDKDRGLVIKATVVLVKNIKYQAGPEMVKELQNHVKKTTAPYKYPRIIEFVEELPKTISGKIRRVEIRDKDKNN